MNNTSTPISSPRTAAGFGRNRIIALVVLAVIFVVLAIVPLLTEGYWLTRLTDYFRYVILAVAWVLFSGPTGYMSLATAAFYGLGFYIAAVANGPLPFVIVIILSG